MEFWSTIVGLIRRAVVIVPATLVAVTLGTLAYLGTPETYVSSTTMVLTTTQYGGSESQDPTQPNQLTNPMLNFSTSLQTTTAILIQTMGTKDVLEQLGVNRGGSTQLIVNDGRTNLDLLGLNGPFLYIEGRSVSAEDARRVVVDARKVMQQKLAEWQRDLNAPKNTYVTLVDVVPPTAPEADSGRPLKLGVMAFLFGFVLCVGIAYFGHQIRARRRARAAAAPAVPDTAPPPARVPEPIHRRHRPRTPVVSPDGDEDAEPAVVSSSARTTAEPAEPMAAPQKTTEPAVPPSARTKAEPALTMSAKKPTEPAVVPATSTKEARPIGPTLEKKTGTVPVPVKVNGRSRNR